MFSTLVETRVENKGNTSLRRFIRFRYFASALVDTATYSDFSEGPFGARLLIRVWIVPAKMEG